MREIIYNIDNAAAGRTVEVTGLTETLTANNVLGIINKTTKKVLYAPTVGALQSVTYANGTLTIVLASTVAAITAGDKLLVKLYSDYSDPSQAAEDLATFFGLPSALPEYREMDAADIKTICDEDWVALYGYLTVEVTMHFLDANNQDQTVHIYPRPDQTYAAQGWSNLYTAYTGGSSLDQTQPTANQTVYFVR